MEWIFPIPKGLKTGHLEQIVPDDDTARVCKRAAEMAFERPEAKLCVTAGWSKPHHVYTGDKVAEYLNVAGQVHHLRILTRLAKHPNRQSEMAAFAALLREPNYREEEHVVFLVVQRWSARHIQALLLASLEPRERERTRIQVIPVRSWNFGILRPFAYIKNMLQ